MPTLWHFLIAFSETSGILDALTNQFINATTNGVVEGQNNCTTFESRAGDADATAVTIATPVILPKEIVVVLIMLTLWIYSIILTVRAWKQFLKDWK